MSSAAALIDRFRNAPPTAPEERERRIGTGELEEVWWKADRAPAARREARSPRYEAPPERFGRDEARAAALAAEDEALLRRELERRSRASAEFEAPSPPPPRRAAPPSARLGKGSSSQ